MATERKVRIGISFDEGTVEALDRHTLILEGLGVDRSEIVNAILSEFFEDSDTNEAVWESVSRRRIKRRKE